MLFFTLFCIRFEEGHWWLARETRKDPVDCDNDFASDGWTNWELAREPLVSVKQEKKLFPPLRPLSGTISLDSPSPSPAKRPCIQRSSPLNSVVPNPFLLGLISVMTMMTICQKSEKLHQWRWK